MGMDTFHPMRLPRGYAPLIPQNAIPCPMDGELINSSFETREDK